MKTMFQHKILVALAVVATLFASYSCEENDVYQFPELSNEESSAMVVMQRDPEFANFIEVLDMCGEGCLDSLLNQARVYTIWAPVNEAINKDSLIECIENGNREDVFQQFVKYHISNYRHPANGTLPDDNSLLMLNGKYVSFTGNKEDGYKYGGQDVVEANILTKNGLVHKIAAPVAYKPSIWESLKSSSLIASFWKFCDSFTVEEIDHINSIPGPIVDQQQTYLDTLYVEHNEILNHGNLFPIDNEDSTYIVYVPTSEVWDRITAEATNYFNFNTEDFNDEQKIEADSLKQVRGAKDYLRYLTYSMTDQEFAGGVVDFNNLPDSLYPMYNETPRKKFAVADLTPVEIIKASNGQLRIIDHMPFKPSQLWHDTIRIEAEQARNVRQDEFEDYVQGNGTFASITENEKEQNPLYEGEVAGGAYMLAVSSGELPYRTYFVKDVLSAKYKIAIITVPQDILEKGDVDKPSQYQSAFEVSVAQSGVIMGEFPDPGKKVLLQSNALAFLPDDAIRPSMTARDTIFLCDDATGEPHIFDFEYCEKFSGFTTKTFENKHYTVDIKIAAVNLAGSPQGNTGKYRKSTQVDNNFRIDAILLIPVEEEESADTENMQ